MMTLNRRFFTLSVPALAAGALWPVSALAASVTDPSPIGEMTLGPDTAKVTIIEYASASCPHCAEFYKGTFQALKKDYIDTGKIRFIFREFPHNQPALAAFMLARCAPKDKYFALIDLFFTEQEKWLASPRDELFKIAQLLGFTQASFDECLKKEDIAKGILSVRDQGASFGVEGIPTFFINGERYNGGLTTEDFRKAIDPLLA
jgi:protein-disulfide isomerase